MVKWPTLLLESKSWRTRGHTVLKYIFGAIFIALAWAAALVFHGVSLLFLAAIVLTVVIVLGLAALAIYRALAGRRSAGALENGLGDLAGRSAGSTRPDQQAEIVAMQVEFQKAIQGLKSSRLGHKGRDALGILPWYIIIGPPGSGKTTALRSSGLQFPYAKGGKVKGVGGTRNCDWWLTNEAIILDTAGRWSTQNDDHDEWLAFLDLLRKTRPGKPVNGILLAVSLLDLEGGEDGIAALSKALRDRLDEVTGRLDMVVPVYLLVTKSDLVPGFVEMFGDLRDKERGQIWGLTLPLMASPDERADLFNEHLEELVDVAGQRAFTRLSEERRVDARFKIFGILAAARRRWPEPVRLGGRPFRRECLSGCPHPARRVLHQRYARRPPHRSHHAEHGRGLRRVE